MGLIDKVRTDFITLLIVYILCTEHPACVIFTAHCESNESVVAALPCLAILLCTEKIIDEMLVPTTGEGSALLEAVKKSVCSDYHNLEKFATILMQSVTSVAASMLKEYSEFNNNT